MRPKTLSLAALCLAGCLAHGPQAPVARPDFSGTWELDLERSSLQSRPPDASTFIIEHEDPQWRLERTHVYGDQSDTLALELTTDDELKTETIRSWEIRSRMHWEGRILVLETTMSRGSQTTTVLVRYSLEDDGRTFIAEERMESGQESHQNLWVFAKVTE